MEETFTDDEAVDYIKYNFHPVEVDKYL